MQSIPKDFLSKGILVLKNITDKNNAVLNFNVERLLTDVNTVSLLMPSLKIPENIRKINKIDFKGFFDGYFYDFVANGNLRTDFG